MVRAGDLLLGWGKRNMAGSQLFSLPSVSEEKSRLLPSEKGGRQKSCSLCFVGRDQVVHCKIIPYHGYNIGVVGNSVIKVS